jgi:hypothetical protein
MVAKYTPPDNTTQNGAAYKSNLDGAVVAGARIDQAFLPQAQDTPNMTVRVLAGALLNGTTLTEVAAQNTGTIVAPVTNPRIDRVVLNPATGAIQVVTGTEAASPVAPAIPAERLPICRFQLATSTTAISNALIVDERVAATPLPSPLPISAGGTGATSASAARAALGVSDGVARSGVKGLTGANNAGTPNTQYDFAADEVLLTTGADGFVLRTATGTLTCNVSTAGPAANGRDQAGAFTAASWVHFWFIWNGTTLATLASASATAPTLPSGYTHRAYMGAVYLNGSSQLVATRLRGSKAFYTSPASALAGGTATVETSVSLASVIPPNALRAQIYARLTVSANTSSGQSFATLRIASGADFHRMEGFQQAGVVTSYETASIDVPNLSQSLFYITGDASGDGVQSLVLNIQSYAIPNGDS